MRPLAIAAGALVLVLGGCETATPYQPLVPGSRVSGGFTDQRLDATHARIGFRGNSVTSRSAVENDMLLRAAEVTVQSGFDWFETMDHHTDAQSRTYVDSLDPWGYGAFSPYWSVWGPGFYQRGFWGGPFWDPSIDVETVQRFEATADIAMGAGARPAGPRAFDARQVIANLGPRVRRAH